MISIFIMSLKTQDSVWSEDSESDVTTEEDYTWQEAQTSGSIT